MASPSDMHFPKTSIAVGIGGDRMRGCPDQLEAAAAGLLVGGGALAKLRAFLDFDARWRNSGQLALDEVFRLRVSLGLSP